MGRGFPPAIEHILDSGLSSCNILSTYTSLVAGPVDPAREANPIDAIVGHPVHGCLAVAVCLCSCIQLAVQAQGGQAIRPAGSIHQIKEGALPACRPKMEETQLECTEWQSEHVARGMVQSHNNSHASHV